MLAAAVTSGNCPALVLNADHRPLSYYPLSLWSWQDTIKAVFLDRVTILEEYDRVVHSARFEMKLPSVVPPPPYPPAPYPPPPGPYPPAPPPIPYPPQPPGPPGFPACNHGYFAGVLYKN